MTFPRFFSQGGDDGYARQLARLMLPGQNAGVNPAPMGAPMPPAAGGMPPPMTPQQAAFQTQQEMQDQQFRRIYGILNTPSGGANFGGA